MKPVNFDYARPKDLDASLLLLAEDGRSIKVVAGSQSLGPMLNMRLVQPDLLLDITGVETNFGKSKRRQTKSSSAPVSRTPILKTGACRM